MPQEKAHTQHQLQRKQRQQERELSRFSRRVRRQIRHAQRNEITENHVYQNLTKLIAEEKHRQIINQIAQDELKHAEFWQQYTQESVKPDRLKVLWYTLLGRLFGFTFAAKLMEKDEAEAQLNYQEIAQEIPAAAAIEADEKKHASQLLKILDEENLKYIGSMVLGVNDALVELTGALAGYTLALQNTRLIAVIGLITGLAASMSMGTSEYLATKADHNEKEPFKAAIYTGGMYILTVILLIIPFYLLSNLYIALAITLTIAVLIILGFTFYISVAQEESFRQRFIEMALISLGVSAISFGIGYVVRAVFQIDI